MTAQGKTSMRLHCEEAGRPHAQTLVFLHGGGSGWMWQPQIQALSREFHCLVLDLPGHGRSRDMPFTLVDTVDQIAALIRERAHGGKAAVIGLSLGAQVLVQLLSTRPEVVDRALISSALMRPMGFQWLATPMMLRWMYRLGVSPFKCLSWYTRLNMRYAAGVVQQYFSLFDEDYQRMSEESFVPIMVANMGFRLPPHLDRATMPVLIVVGKREYGVMKESAHDLAVALPNVRGVIVDVGRNTAENHNWNLNAPDLFNRLVRAWMTDQPLPTEVTPF